VLTGREPYSGTDGVIAAGVNEALVQDYDDVLRVGPAVPSDWDVDGTVSVQDNAKVDVQTGGRPRIHLAHGIRQRHTHGPKTARRCLTLAAEAFERLGAVTWAERAWAELRVAGMATRAPSVPSAELTWQERRMPISRRVI
jgi:hypothetical protein